MASGVSRIVGFILFGMDVMGGFFVIAPMVDHGLGRRLVAMFAALAVMASLVGFAEPAKADDTATPGWWTLLRST